MICIENGHKSLAENGEYSNKLNEGCTSAVRLSQNKVHVQTLVVKFLFILKKKRQKEL